ncbi:MAG: SurA N-terminal domain-containing protein [Halioglobus sp.]|nr:SurA N-terminal domain-containing protein [Halioglobus sp.]
MLQKMRQKAQGLGFRIIIGLIVIAFAGFGVESILLDGGGNEVAVVNGEKISPQQLQLSIQNQQRRMIAMLGDNLDPSMLDDERLAPLSLEALINRRLLMQASGALGLVITKRELGAVVAATPEFQVDGVFSPERYRALLSEAGFTPNSYRLNLGEDMILSQVSGGLAGSEFVTPAELNLNAEIISELRDFSYFTIPREDYVAMTVPEESEIDAYYETHLDDFRTPESVDVDYIELTLDSFRAPVGEQTLQDAYELAKMDLQYKTQHRVSHILFEGDSDSIRQRIAQAQEKLAGGATFMQVAADYSDDVGSAAKGGDLGYTSGATFPEEMEIALAELELGIVSEPVITSAGSHLLLVTERTTGEPPSFEDMREELEQRVQREEARIELLRAVEILRDISFNADDLDTPAAELDLQVHRLPGVTRTGGEGIFASAILTEAAFSDEVLSQGHNSDVIELQEEHFVVLRVSKYNESEVQDLDAVRGSITAALNAESIDAGVSTAANTALAALRRGETLQDYAARENYELGFELGIDRRNDTVPPDILRRVFELPSPEEGQVLFDYVTAFNGDAIVIELQRVTPGDYQSLEAGEQNALLRTLTSELGNLIFQEYQRALRAKAEISVL